MEEDEKGEANVFATSNELCFHLSKHTSARLEDEDENRRTIILECGLTECFICRDNDIGTGRKREWFEPGTGIAGHACFRTADVKKWCADPGMDDTDAAPRLATEIIECPFRECGFRCKYAEMGTHLSWGHSHPEMSPEETKENKIRIQLTGRWRWCAKCKGSREREGWWRRTGSDFKRHLCDDHGMELIKGFPKRWNNWNMKTRNGSSPVAESSKENEQILKEWGKVDKITGNNGDEDE